MRNSLKNFVSKSRPLQWAAFAIGVLIAVWFFRQSPVEAPTVIEEIENTEAALVAEVSEPLRLMIPDVGIDTQFTEPVGVLENGEVEVPAGFEEVAYYKYGPTPGELGPAVILGHVDSKDGPAVFYSLGQLEKSDEILIEREDGSTLVFEVENLERHLQAGFPTEKVYGNLPYAGLRLITCSGTYDRGQQRYTHNLIVFAKLKEVR